LDIARLGRQHDDFKATLVIEMGMQNRKVESRHARVEPL
jgi:hypothetical protein